ncbi:MAG: EAL domain-containing protein [Propionivibrio sp.]|nr:EAL domain-containing protein [Propionivibrio sp.]
MRLLLIDDDELDRQAVLRALRQGSVDSEVSQATTAAAGLKLALEEVFDIILLDYRLPDQDGLDVLRKLPDKVHQSSAMIMLSNVEDETVAEHCLDAGAQAFLLKDDLSGRRLSRALRQARQRHSIETELISSREQLRQLSEHDPLTGLANRRGFEIFLEAAIARARRGNDRLAILLLDLDDFKSINDTLGHDAGDVVLKEVAKRLNAAVRDSDLLCRLGGDEFAVLMTNFDENEQVKLLADRIVALLQEPIHLVASDHVVTTSIGIAVLDTCAENVVDLLKCADVAMYQAKQDGRNQSRYYSTTLQESVQLRASMKQDMKKALERGEFKVYYQAQISSADGSLGGMEALLRWQHPALGLLAPAAFLTVAEETGLIVDIGNWVLRESCRQLKDWQIRWPLRCPTLAIAVNLSAVQIRQHTLPDAVRSALAEFALDARSLELEITESTLIRDTNATAAMLAAIADQGVALSLDDFGTGYSSLDHLKLFPISVLKIDKSFVATIGAGGKSERLLVATIAFAKALEMKVVAEGVETKVQADFCIGHGCDLLQGYFYSRPIPADEFEAAFLLAKT